MKGSALTKSLTAPPAVEGTEDEDDGPGGKAYALQETAQHLR